MAKTQNLDEQIPAFDISNTKYIGRFTLSELDDKYKEWRANGYGVLIDRDAAVCVDKEDPDDDGKSYKEQLKDLHDNF
jgi:hypothetical protein